MSVVDSSFDHPLNFEEGAVAPLAGGIMGNGYQCGMLWGAALAAGAQAYQLLGPGAQAEAEAVSCTQKLVESFLARNKYINCSELTDLNLKLMNSKEASKRSLAAQGLKFIFKGGPIVCFSMSAYYARAAFNEINTGVGRNPVEAPASPVSCAALLAQKMGASDLHVVMAAGFAGGIGLSGGACGALGAALWIAGMKYSQEKGVKIGYENPIGMAVIEKYLESADYEFECSKIVGRKFENVTDHASYLHQGGCTKIIDALAAIGQDLTILNA